MKVESAGGLPAVPTDSNFPRRSSAEAVVEPATARRAYLLTLERLELLTGSSQDFVTRKLPPSMDQQPSSAQLNKLFDLTLLAKRYVAAVSCGLSGIPVIYILGSLLNRLGQCRTSYPVPH